jgi:hypothetical protein
MSTPIDQARRRAELAKIHLAKKELGWSDDVYRDVIRRISDGRTESSGKLNARERGRVLDYMKDQGFGGKPKASPDEAFDRVKRELVVRPDQKPQEALIEALWEELQRQGAFEINGQASLAVFLRRMAKVAHPRWLDNKQSNEIVEALKAWLRRITSAKAVLRGRQ